MTAGERSHVCSAPAITVEGGVIYVRVLLDGRWQSAPICRACWDTRAEGLKP